MLFSVMSCGKVIEVLKYWCVLQNLLKACEEENVDAFTEALRDFDSISRLDKNLTAMLLKVKKQLSSEPELC